MWKEYSSDFIKNNRSFGLSVRLAAFISALLLSLLCVLFYNLWKYEVERIELEEGGWQSRIVGELNSDDIEFIKSFASVEDVLINEKYSTETETAADIYFYDYGKVLSDTPKIAELIGAASEKIVYNHPLLAMYLIRDPGDKAPRLLFPMFMAVMVLASVSLIVIIHNSFAVTMNARIHQFGIFSSIGATPKQIRTCLLQEAAALCAVPVIVGNFLGIVSSMVLIQLTNAMLGSDAGRHRAVFGCHPFVLLLTLFVTVVTIWISAWLPAGKLSRLTPLEAIKNTGELQLKRRRNSYFLAHIFGVEGELAGNALKAQRKALRTAALSFLFSFLAFTVMQSFFSLSRISTRETYFERYQDVWDIMITLKGADVDAFEETEEVRGLTGVENCVVYQKAKAKRIISEEEISDEMKAFGGFSHASCNYVTKEDDGWVINVPIMILDDNSFLAYCEQIGITPGLDGAVVINRIRDVTNPDFRHPTYMPYIKTNSTGKNFSSVLLQSGNEEMTAEVPILTYTEEFPILREEYATQDYYELVHFISVSLWREIKGQTGGAEEDTYIRILCRENASSEELNTLQSEIHRLLAHRYTIESENRIQEYETNNSQIKGMMTIAGGFCVLLAIIGIGNVFSNTFGFVRQRKREFARYLSVGMTLTELRKMFCIEALVIAVRPTVITLPLAVIAVGYLLKLSYVGVLEFMEEAPLVPIVMFMLAILASVAAAYFLAWRNVRKISLAEVLRDDTMM